VDVHRPGHGGETEGARPTTRRQLRARASEAHLREAWPTPVDLGADDDPFDCWSDEVVNKALKAEGDAEQAPAAGGDAAADSWGLAVGWAVHHQLPSALPPEPEEVDDVRWDRVIPAGPDDGAVRVEELHPNGAYGEQAVPVAGPTVGLLAGSAAVPFGPAVASGGPTVVPFVPTAATPGDVGPVARAPEPPPYPTRASLRAAVTPAGAESELDDVWADEAETDGAEDVEDFEDPFADLDDAEWDAGGAPASSDGPPRRVSVLGGPLNETALAKGPLDDEPEKGSLDDGFGRGTLDDEPGKGALDDEFGRGTLDDEPGKGSLDDEFDEDAFDDEFGGGPLDDEFGGGPLDDEFGSAILAGLPSLADTPEEPSPDAPPVLGPQPGVLPTLGDLLATRPVAPSGPAELGWRAVVRRISGGLVAPPPGAAEREDRAAIRSVQRNLDGPRTVVVINPKGGAHKTTATLLLAATFGRHRGGYTLAWDNNETRGTLGWRSQRTGHLNTAVDLLDDLDRFAEPDLPRVGDLDNYVRSQGSAQFDVLASDEDAASAASIDDFAFRALHRTLSRFYRILVIDTGNNMRASNWQAAIEAADQVVVVSTMREDTAQSAAWALDALRATGHEDVVRNAVTVLSLPAPRRDAGLATRLHDHFGRLTREVIEVPYEPELVAGGPIDYEALSDATRRAWLRVASVVAEGV
jgi:MinD-like ATPase involved in chromosome partitioning or flagellar assembly